MKSLNILPDDKLIIAYQKSITLGLEKDFIHLLQRAIKERKLDAFLTIHEYNLQRFKKNLPH